MARDALPEQAKFLAEPLATAVRTVTHEFALRFLESSQFRALWSNANRAAHALVRKALTGEGGAISTRGGRIVVDLTAVATEVRDRLVNAGLTLFRDIPAQDLRLRYQLFDARELERLQSATRLLDRMRIVLPVLAVLCVGVALALSGDRRRTLLRWGLGVAAATGLVGVVLAVTRWIYLDAVTTSTIPRDAAAAAFDTLVRFLRTSVRSVTFLGLVVAGAAFLVGPGTVAERIRASMRRVARGATEHMDEARRGAGTVGAYVAAHAAAARALGIVAAIALLVFWDDPTTRVAAWTAALLLVYLAVVEILVRGRVVPPAGTED